MTAPLCVPPICRKNSASSNSASPVSRRSYQPCSPAALYATHIGLLPWSTTGYRGAGTW